MQSEKSIGELVHTESVAILGDLPQSRTITHLDANLIENASDDWRRGGGWNSGNYPLPRIAFDGGTSAWIVGRIAKSPTLSIDDQRSDFEPLQELHLFVQEIPPEDMPEAWLREHQLRLEQEMKAMAAEAP